MTTNLAIIEAAIEEIHDDAHDSFGALEVVGSEENRLQYTPGSVNAYYPFNGAPADRLATLAFDDLKEWKPGIYVTLGIWRPTKELAVWIDRYFREILSCRPNYELKWTLEHP